MYIHSHVHTYIHTYTHLQIQSGKGSPEQIAGAIQTCIQQVCECEIVWCVCVCMHIYIYIHTHTHIYAYIICIYDSIPFSITRTYMPLTCMHVSIQLVKNERAGEAACIHTVIHTYMCTYRLSKTSVLVRPRAYIHLHIHTWMCTYTHLRIHACVHTDCQK
jgi:hypothetical protein